MKSPSHQQYLIDSKGHRRAIVIDLDTYEKMVEDMADLKVVAERKTNPKYSATRFVMKLKKNDDPRPAHPKSEQGL